AKRVLVNAAMLFSITVATIGCVWGLSGRGVWGQAGIALLVVLSVWGIVEFLRRENRPAALEAA
ncbi:MAG: hypothetical protein AAF561_16160, partial [Planctomycetota bacterium]